MHRYFDVHPFWFGLKWDWNVLVLAMDFQVCSVFVILLLYIDLNVTSSDNSWYMQAKDVFENLILFQ